jgi:hypothetical protein
MNIDTLALLLTFLLVSLIGFFSVIVVMVLISRDTTKIPELVSRVSSVEALMGMLTADVGAEIAASHASAINSPREIWRTADGRYEAGSFEELLSKMADDPESGLTVEEIESIQSIFEKIMGLPNEDDEDDEEKWKPKGSR